MENQAQQPAIQMNQPMQSSQPQGDIGFAQPKPKKQGKPWLWIVGIIITVLIIVIGGWALMRNFNSSEEGSSATPTPEAAGLNTFATPEPTSTPAPTPTESVSVSDLEVSILNGTGKAGEASFLKSELVDLGFGSDNIEAANADEQDETKTTVVFGPKVDEDTQAEVEALLEKIYKKVSVQTKTLDQVDIQITTGPRIDS